ncbi:tyrosine-type recombinase/integrase [Pseudomonas shahriarae]|uniref:Tyrosine-type recombinase/integrase n=1 Tax=Pseudomonas shahriarae TaxID=2745512 RepID=A0A9X4C8E7_9PSED|nr:tyrosine-type recombinase/integrase [Pseudomonas shahriarae]MDD1011813.1 tyrosine-type recombinase/integrase [Pseudomonas shahriarae]
MRPRKADTRNLPPRMYQWTRTRKSGKVWIAYYYLDMTGKAIPLGKDLDLARVKWAELEAKEKPLDLRTMKGIFDRYIRDIVSKKAARTQKDNLAEIKQLRPMFDNAPIDSITPATIAGYRDARTAKVRANREIATLSHVFNIAREWGLTTKENPCQGVRKNKETPRDYYANDVVWDAVYVKAAQELKDAMDLAYLTGQRPADVLVMRKDDIEGNYLGVQQNKTHKKLRIQMTDGDEPNSLGLLIGKMAERNALHICSYLIVSARGKRMTAKMLRDRWDDARERAKKEAVEKGDVQLAEKIGGFQFRDIRPKAASEILDVGDASLLLGHTKGDITERVYRRIGAIAKPSK